MKLLPLLTGEELMYYENFDIKTVVTPVNPDRLEQLLLEASYDPEETAFLVNGFRQGFDLGCKLDVNRDKIKIFAPNLKLRVGNPVTLWNKVMKEVKLGRYAGPFKQVPYPYFVQSPIGLVPKDGGRTQDLFFICLIPDQESLLILRLPRNCVRSSTVILLKL